MGEEISKRATAAQVRRYKWLHANEGIVVPSSRLRRFKALTVSQASADLTRVEEELRSLSVLRYVAPDGMATARQLAYFSKLRTRLGSPVEASELEQRKGLSWTEMQQLNSDTMKLLQQRNDANGVPLPAWRHDRMLYDADDLRAGDRAAAVRRAERERQTRQRIRDRQERKAERSGRGGGWIYPGER